MEHGRRGEEGAASFTGNLIAESLRTGGSIDGAALSVNKILRLASGDPSAGQPVGWTFIELAIPAEEAERFADVLSMELEEGPWYCDFHSDDETFVVFSHRVFRYPRGDVAGRAEAEAHARSVGVPESQVDWRV